MGIRRELTVGVLEPVDQVLQGVDGLDVLLHIRVDVPLEEGDRLLVALKIQTAVSAAS